MIIETIAGRFPSPNPSRQGRGASSSPSRGEEPSLFLPLEGEVRWG